MKTRNLRFIEDPGHGWLEVDKVDLVELEIANKISHFSYMDKGQGGITHSKVYLEEDCDAGIFIDAAKEAGWLVCWNCIHQDPTFIRELPGYSA